MSVSLERIQEKLKSRFANLERVNENVFRFERLFHKEPYAVCYVDVSPRLPESDSALQSYQEKIVARRYFEGRKSLQWNNYLYFIVAKQPSQDARLVVERDRKFARKFVLTETEFDVSLAPASFKLSEAARQTDILTTWTNILADAQLDQAILNDESLPRRLDLIEAFFAQATTTPPKSKVVPQQSTQPFLRHISLKDFRQYPRQREFNIGSVTLICGANGTGKTSLLEAIEPPVSG